MEYEDEMKRSYLNPHVLGSRFHLSPGWRPLLNEFVEVVDGWIEVDDHPLRVNPWQDFEIVQIKQKWGYLVIYFEGAPEHRQDGLRNLAGKLYSASYDMCEECSTHFDPPHLNARCSDACEEARQERRNLTRAQWRARRDRERAEVVGKNPE